ncbi:MAG: Dabb family protein [Chromatiales bacterium]
MIVWLKEAGNEAVRKQYIDASKRLGKLPGVVTYRIGRVMPGKGEGSTGVADNSFDIAVTSTFENQQALAAYLQSEEHRRIIDEELRPIVKKCIVYDFAE